MTYASELIVCGHCGHPITGEKKTKKPKAGERQYVYYRCTHYNVAGHPRVRVTEADLDRQVLAIFDKMRIEDEEVRDWFRAVLQSQTQDAQADSLAQRAELQRQMTLAVNQQDRLLDLRINREIDARHLRRKADRTSRSHCRRSSCNWTSWTARTTKCADLAVKVFELSQTLRQKWLTADYATKRRILEIVFLNCRLDDVTLVPTIRKPFDVLAEGLLVQSSRGDRI